MSKHKEVNLPQTRRSIDHLHPWTMCCEKSSLPSTMYYAKHGDGATQHRQPSRDPRATPIQIVPLHLHSRLKNTQFHPRNAYSRVSHRKCEFILTWSLEITSRIPFKLDMSFFSSGPCLGQRVSSMDC